MKLFRTPRERNLWLEVAGVLLLIYSTLSVVRPFSEWLRDWGGLIPALILLFGGVAGWGLRGLRRRWPGRLESAVLVGVAVAYGILFFALRTPEEAMHFVEYGLVAVLVYEALAERRRARPGDPEDSGDSAWLVRWPALGALALTGAAGWLDEGIQHLLPTRYYDLRDVFFNAAAAALAVAAVAGREWARRRDARRDEPSG